MEFRQVIEQRHSHRSYSEKPVDSAIISRVLSAASLAPSAYNEQPWHFHVAQGEVRGTLGSIIAQATEHLREYMDQLTPEQYESAVEWYSSLGGAPVVIGVSMTRPYSEHDRTNKLLSVGAAIENLLLAATDEGLASCSITFTVWAADEIAACLEIPTDREVVVVIALGWPGDVPPVAPVHEPNVAEWLG